MFQYSGLGCVFAGGVLVFLAAGWVVDGWLGWFPVFTTIGALGGATLSTLSVWKTLQKSLNAPPRSTDKDKQ